MENETVSQGMDLAFTLYALGGTFLVAAIGYGLKKIGGFLDAKTKNEMLSGILGRLQASIFDAVKMVDQTLRHEIEEAKKSGSDGGSKITKDEARQMRAAVWDVLKKEYGGLTGLQKFMGPMLNSGAVEDKINTMIESAVNTKSNP